MILISTLCVLALLSFVHGNGFNEPPRPRDINTSTTQFLDHDAPIKGYFATDWLKENIPYIDIPDKTIQDVYYYRWSALQRHFRYTAPGSGYIVTEFVTPVGYAKRFGTIDAAAGHHLMESRWLRSTFYGNDYINLWARGGGDSHQYTHWIQYAAVQRAYLNGDFEFAKDRLYQLIDMWNIWYDSYDSDVGLYYFEPLWDAQERSLPGFVYAAEYCPGNETMIFNGPDTYRPTHNAYMAANAREIANVAKLTGDTAIADNFTKIAEGIETSMLKYLWNDKIGVFADVIRPNNPSHKALDGRQEVGWVPYRFNIGLDKKYDGNSAPSILSGTMDTTYGPPTLEITNQYYNASMDECCWWNGQSWPFLTAHIVDSFARMVQSKSSNLTAEQYHSILLKYARTQYKNGQPYVAECHSPTLNEWTGDSFNHSEHYAHSTYNDNVLTGLLGVIPSQDNVFELNPVIPTDWSYFAIENLPYHGHLVTVLYDKDGSRYHQKKGLSVYIDGELAYNGNDLAPTKVNIDPKSYPQDDDAIQVNIAANPIYSGYPIVQATTDQAEQGFINDGYLYYDDIPNNRWVTNTSTNANNTITLEFARKRQFSSITLALYSDTARGGNIDCPDKIEVYDENDELVKRVSDYNCTPNTKNTIDLGKTVQSKVVKVNLWNKPKKFVGVCELEIWVAPNNGPVYYAADALLSNGQVVENKASDVGYSAQLVNGTSQINFNGVVAQKAEEKTIEISYTSSEDVSMGLQVNFWGMQNFTLPQTGNKLGSVTQKVKLFKGLNFVNLFGGNTGLVVDFIKVGS